MPQVAVIAKITALPGKRDEVAAVLKETVLPAVKEEQGTLLYAMNLDKGNEDVIWFYELYADEAAMAAHSGSDAMKAAGGQLRDKAAGRPEITMLQLEGGKGLPV